MAHKYVLTETVADSNSHFSVDTTVTNLKKPEPRFTILYQDDIFPLSKLQPRLLRCSRGRSCRETVGLYTIEIYPSVSGAAATAKAELRSPGG